MEGLKQPFLGIAFLGLLAFSNVKRLSDWLGMIAYCWYVTGHQVVFGQALESDTLPAFAISVVGLRLGQAC